MDCREEVMRPKKEVTLTFKRSELVYDISNYCYVEGDVMPTEAEHARHQVLDVAESGNIDRVTRMLNLAHAECVEFLYPYTKEEVTDGEMSSDLAEPEQYEIRLSLPIEFSKTTVNKLTNLLHEYLVCSVVADWLSITKPSASENWTNKLYITKTKIQSTLMSRTKILKRKLKPF